MISAWWPTWPTRVAVMRHGRVVESGTVAEVLGDPAHSYTRALIAAVPRGESQLPPPRRGAAAGEGEGLTKRFRRGGLFTRARTVDRGG